MQSVAVFDSVPCVLDSVPCVLDSVLCVLDSVLCVWLWSEPVAQCRVGDNHHGNWDSTT